MINGRVKVILREDSMGNVTIEPVSDRVHDQLLEEYGKYLPEGYRFDIFIQEANASDYRDTFPRRAFYRGDWNDGAVFLLDVDTFRHMVGYQAG